jgi:competence protein ComEC
VAGLPGAQVLVAQWPMTALVLLAVGGLWLALWQRPWRWLGLAPIAGAALTVALARPPDLLVDGGLGMAALRHPDRTVTLVEWQRDRMVRETWLRHFGVAEGLPAPRPGEGPARGMACDPFGCVLALGERRVALARRAEAVREDCGLADFVIARVGSERCAGATPALGPRALAASGGIAVRLDEGELHVETVAGTRGRWPWVTGAQSQ